MTTSAAAAPAVRASFTHLIDYAGLFPPAALDMVPAVREYAAERHGAFAWMLGRFIVPASRIADLLAAHALSEPLALSVIVDAGSDARTWLSAAQAKLEDLCALRASRNGGRQVRIEALEVALPLLQTQRDTYDAAIGQFAAAAKQACMDDLPAFVELPRDARWRSELRGALFALSRHRLKAKLRCGGVTADAFPGVEDVAAFVHGTAAERVAFKATAGLHHPVRHRDAATGAMMHGFLNLLTAAAFAHAGCAEEELCEILACEDASLFTFGPDGLWWNGRQVETEVLRAVRSEGFVSYGSCSFSEPTGDLHGLGML